MLSAVWTNVQAHNPKVRYIYTSAITGAGHTSPEPNLLLTHSAGWPTDFLKMLPPNLIVGDTLFVHGSPKDSVTKYIFELDEVELIEILQSLSENVVFVGTNQFATRRTVQKGPDT